MLTPERLLHETSRLLDELYDVSIAPEALGATPWRAVGLESLALMDVLLHLERAYDCQVPNEALRGVETFGDLAAQLLAHGATEPAP